MRERLFSKKSFWKITYKNKSYFYYDFLLTKNSFPLISFFFFFGVRYKTLKNIKNYLYKMFSSETIVTPFYQGLLTPPQQEAG